jgi:hypothetical protein
VARLQIFKSITAQQWSIAALFLLMPHIYAFGTNGNYWVAGGSAAIFWLLAGLILLIPLIRLRASWSIVLPAALATQAITAVLLQTGLERPYRQNQPLRLNESAVEIGPRRSVLVLSEDYAQYIAKAVSISKAAGFTIDTPIIDLTGQSPGILYIVGGKLIGQAWTIGGYPGSLKRATLALNSIACDEIASAWVLYEPEGPRSISSELLTQQGIIFPNDYKLVDSFFSPEGAGGYFKRRKQIFYEPLNITKSKHACELKRLK